MTHPSAEIRSARPSDQEAMDALVDEDARASIFQRPIWGRAVERQFGHSRADLVAWDGDRLVGVLPLSLVRSLGGGRALISVPYGVYGGALGKSSAVREALLSEAVARSRAKNYRRLELRCRVALEPVAAESFTISDLYCGFSRTLPQQVEQVLGSIPKKARADVRRAREKMGLTLDEGPWYLPDLVRLFQANKQALGSPALPHSWFARLLEDLGKAATIHVARRGSLVLAAVMSFVDGDELHAYYSGTLAGADRDYKASSFLYCSLQEWAVEQGLSRFDFGRSRKGSGAADFKRRQGFEAQDLPYAYCLVKDKGLPSMNPSNPKTAPLRGIWSKIPAGLAVRLGGFGSRYLP